jgi:hypothetical protein
MRHQVRREGGAHLDASNITVLILIREPGKEQGLVIPFA